MIDKWWPLSAQKLAGACYLIQSKTVLKLTRSALFHSLTCPTSSSNLSPTGFQLS